MSILNSVEVQNLRTKLVSEMKKSPPRTGILASMNLSLWLAKTLTQEEFGCLNSIEESCGEEAANVWFTKVLVESGIYESDDGETVQQVVS